jgi:FkbM family methyltransferase
LEQPGEKVSNPNDPDPPDLADSEDQPFTHYPFAHGLISWLSYRVCGNLTYTVRHGLNTGLRRKGGLGFLPPFLSRAAHTPETHFWQSLNLKDKVVYDIGAFEGHLACFFARQARQVVCYEPVPPTRARMVENLSLNSLTNVTIRPIGLSSQPGSFTLTWDPLIPGAASTAVSGNNPRLLTAQVPVSTLDHEIANHQPDPDFVKVDVEGLELNVLQGGEAILRRCHPDLFIELHGETLREKRAQSRAVIQFLLSLGYNDVYHVEQGSRVADPLNPPPGGHLYCRSLSASNSNPPQQPRISAVVSLSQTVEALSTQPTPTSHR